MRRPDLRIGFFLHIPFPPIELFMQMPYRAEVLRGPLGADLVGFQQRLAAQNFVRLARHLLGTPYHGNLINVEGRQVKAGAFPITIDTGEMERLAANPAVRARAKQIRAELGDPKTVILGVDRLDYTKGIEQRLKAYRELLSEGKLKVPESVMVQVATPSRERVEHYQALRIKSGARGGPDQRGVRQGRRALRCTTCTSRTANSELAALYRAADVMMVTPLRDGMNLVAKEYVAARADTGGALVLSEFAGAATEMRQAFLCNPLRPGGGQGGTDAGDHRRTSRGPPPDAGDAAPPAPPRRRAVGASFLSELEQTRRHDRPRPRTSRRAGAPGPRTQLLVASDYDGALAPIVADPSQAAPIPGAVAALTDLAGLPQTAVAVVSGRGRADPAALSGHPDPAPRGQPRRRVRHGFTVHSGGAVELQQRLRAPWNRSPPSTRAYAWRTNPPVSRCTPAPPPARSPPR